MNDPLVALVTGANKGIGLEIARRLAAGGSTVLVGARDAAAGAATAAAIAANGGTAQAIALDLDDRPGLAAAAARIERDHGRLDILVNNAGIVMPGDAAPGSADHAAVERTFAVNLFGTLAVTQAMLPLLRRSPAGRIVIVSSGLGSLTRNARDPRPRRAIATTFGYNASKAALNMLAILLAEELADTTIKVNAVAPGFTATDLNGNSGTQTVEQGAVAAVRMALLDADGPSGGFFDANGAHPW